jgi:hypothetical protein
MNRTFIIKVDSYSNRESIFGVLLGLVKQLFATLKKADYSRGQSFFGIWNTYFVIDKSEHTQENHDRLYEALSALYESNPSLANGYKVVWEGDRTIRKAHDVADSLERFGEGSYNLNVSEDDLATVEKSSDGDLLVNLIQYVAEDRGAASNTSSGFRKCFSCDSRIAHLGFTDRDAAEGIRLSLVEKNQEAYDSFLRTIGGECPACGYVSCCGCYQDRGFKCAKCGAKIPHFHGQVP